MASFFLSLKYPLHDSGFRPAFFFSWVVAVAVAVVQAVGQVLVRGLDVSFSVCKS